MVNFGLLAAEIGPVIWATPANFNGFHALAALLHRSPRAQPLGVGGPDPKIWTDHPNFFDEECDYRYVTDCSA